MTITETLPTEPTPVEPLPRIYLACPLTNLAPARRGTVGLTIDVIRTTVEAVTFNDHAAGDRWPVSLYAPYNYSAPWNNDGLSSSAVYEKNLTELLDSDALIVVADQGASAGVGQEIEWASRSGLPILYLTTTTASRQIAGTPAHITCVAYGDDTTTMKAQLTNWLRASRLRIEAGPRRRDNRALRYASLTGRLDKAWRSTGDPTSTAARCNLHPNFISSVLANPARVALIAADTLSLLCAELGVRPPGANGQLRLHATRAWMAATETHGWDDRAAERLRMLGLAAQQQNAALDLDTSQSWVDLHAQHA